MSEERSAQDKNVEDWLPVTASRKAKWNVRAPGVIALGISWLVTLYSLWQMVQMHEALPGKRFDRYHELGQFSFGPKLGFWIVAPQQFVVQMATNIVYMVTGGKSLKKFFDIVVPEFGSIRKTYFIVIFASLQLVLSQTPNFNSLRGISLIAALMSLSYSAISFIASALRGPHHGVRHGVRSSTPAGITFDVFNALGTVAFAFAGHSVVLEIQATMPSSQERPSKIPMWRGVIVAYIIVALCYFSVALSGYWAFGDLVDDDILISLEKPPWLIAAANMMVFLHVLGSYQVFAMPVFDMIEALLVIKYKLTPSLPLRIIARSLYVALTAFVAICIPFFGGLLGFFGGLVFSPTSYFLPCIMWLFVKKPKAFSFHWTASWVSTIIGTLLMMVAPIGGLRQIILDAKSYKFFS